MPAAPSTASRHAPPWRRLLGARALRAVLAVELLVALAVAFGLWSLRRQTLDGELRMLASLSAAMAAQADGTLDLAAATLRTTLDEQAGGLLQAGSAASQALLHQRAAALPRFRALRLVDAGGSGPAGDDGVLRVGAPGLSGTDGQPAVNVSMARGGTAGHGPVAAQLEADPEFLDGDFQRIAPTPDTALAIYRRDRELVSDGPGDGSAQLLPGSAMDGLWLDADPQRPRLLQLPDGRRRLVAAHLLQRYPLMVVVTRDAGAALAEWTEQAWLVAAFAASALAVTLLLTLRNAREQALRQASEAALAAEQARAVRAFQAAQEGHWEWNPLSGETHLSPRMKELLGVARDATLPGGDAVLDQGPLHPDDLPALREAFAAHQQGRTPVFDSSFRVRHADGRWHHVRARGHAWRDAAGQAQLFSGTAVDITDEVEGREQRQRLEAQLQRASKLEALGTLAGGVAHDFNNILASVIGYGELARDAAAPASAQARQLDQVLQAGQRGKQLVERILAFSRGTPRAHTVFLLAPVVEEVLQLLAAALPAGVELQSELAAPGAAIRGDPTQLYEAVMNLCTNGLQALQGRPAGSLRVALHTEERTQPETLFETTLAPGRYACLAVSDNGAGITPEVMARLFEPFFTTRQGPGPQRGTGLGLAVVHGVVADLGGAIDVRSQPGQGACFTLYFPLADAAVVTPAEPAELPLGQGQTVLVVDDEPALVALAEELLAGLGYEPFGLASSTEALARFREAPERFDLVLTDELMPELSGTALAAELHQLRPGLPVVLASGWGGPQLEQRAAAAGVTVLVKKPLARAELARAVATAMLQA